MQRIPNKTKQERTVSFYIYLFCIFIMDEQPFLSDGSGDVVLEDMSSTQPQYLSASSSSSSPTIAADAAVFIPRLVEHLNNMNVYDEEIFLCCARYLDVHRIAHHAEKQYIEQRIIQDGGSTLVERARRVLRYPFQSYTGVAYFVLSTLLVLLSCIAVSMETVPRYSPDLDSHFKHVWFICDLVPTIFFSLDLFIRFAVARNKRTHFLSIINCCDVLAVLPLYIDVFSNEAFDVAPLRIARLVRVLKFFRHFKGIDTLFVAMHRSLFALVGPVVFLGICIILSSSFVYYAEVGSWDGDRGMYLMPDCVCENDPAFAIGKRQCPYVEARYTSIPTSFWWAAVTLSTVGYGDMTPTCTLGRVIATASMLLGVFFLAMPIAIVGGYFTMTVESKSQRRAVIKRSGVSRRRAAHELIGVSFRATGSGSHLSAGDRLLAWVKANYRGESLSLDGPTKTVLYLLDKYLMDSAESCPSCGERQEYAHMHDAYELHVVEAPAAMPRVISLHHSPTLLLGPNGAHAPEYGRSLPLDIVGGPNIVPGLVHARVQLLWLTRDSYSSDGGVPLMKVFPPSDDGSKSVHLNGMKVTGAGADVFPGDIINFNTPSYPVSYRVHIEPMTAESPSPTSAVGSPRRQPGTTPRSPPQQPSGSYPSVSLRDEIIADELL
eukprot:PhM_4_TR4868/c0_g1_i1/m.66442